MICFSSLLFTFWQTQDWGPSVGHKVNSNPLANNSNMPLGSSGSKGSAVLPTHSDGHFNRKSNSANLCNTCYAIAYVYFILYENLSEFVQPHSLRLEHPSDAFVNCLLYNIMIYWHRQILMGAMTFAFCILWTLWHYVGSRLFGC